MTDPVFRTLGLTKVYRTGAVEVQALRGVSVLLVVLYHAWPSVLAGGYVGVDVFFVISGYLITGLLLREIEADGFRVLHQRTSLTPLRKLWIAWRTNRRGH